MNKDRVMRLFRRRNRYKDRLMKVTQVIMREELEYYKVKKIPSGKLYDMEKELKKRIHDIEHRIEKEVGRKLNKGSFKKLYEECEENEWN